MKHLSFIYSLFALVFILGCDRIGDNKLEDNPKEIIELTRSEAECNSVSRSFAASILESVNSASGGKSFFISPMSIEFALGLLANGAAGESREQILKALGTNDLESLNSYSRTMLSYLPTMDKKSRLSLANLALFNSSVSINKDYKKSVENFYDAEVTNMDFSQSQKAISYVNKWASEKTNGTINKLIDDMPNQVCFLANAIYFKGLWKDKFENTSKENFYLENGEKIKVKMMKTTKELSYCGYDNFNVLFIPYGNGSFNMVVILPDEGYKIDDIIPKVKHAMTSGLQSPNNSGRSVLTKVPVFKCESKIDLTGPLSRMGVTSIFTKGNADFSNMTPSNNVFVNTLLQKSYISVNEKGTEAAAVTYAAVDGMSRVPEIGEFIADRPFLYCIIETATRAVLFAGRYSGE